MKVRFIKAHPAGIPEGAIRDLTESHAGRLKNEGYVDYVVPDPMDPSSTPPATVDLTKLTNAKLEEMLTERNIAFEPGKLKKVELIELLTNADNNQ